VSFLKPIKNWLLLPLLTLTLLLVCRPLPAEDKAAGPENVAIVNGSAISRQAYDRELKVFMQRNARIKAQVTEARLALIKKDILENLIDQELLYQESQKQGIAITDQAIDDQLAGIKKRFPSEEEFIKALSRMQISQADVKAQIRRGIAIKELMDKEIIERIVITDEETKNYYDDNPKRFKEAEQVKASHIIIRVKATAEEKTKAEARQKIEAVQHKIKAGQDFAALAKEYSDGPSGAKGGDLGYFKRGQMVPAFEDAAFVLEPNQVSDIVETQFGYHLIKVYDKKPERMPAYEEVKEKITEQIQKEKMDKAARQYIGNLKKKATIEKLL
jgi:peptidyl-prolyl cis-trans isomerase C